MSPTVEYARVSSFGQVWRSSTKNSSRLAVPRSSGRSALVWTLAVHSCAKPLNTCARLRSSVLGHKRTFHTLSPSRHHHPPFGHDHLGNSNRNEHVLQKDVSDSLDTICAIEVQKANIRTALFVSETLKVGGRRAMPLGERHYACLYSASRGPLG